jgi:hypothetical protein
MRPTSAPIITPPESGCEEIPQTTAARIDWSDWLRSLSRRQRAIASTLAGGETTGVAARKFRISQARISQLRAWFKENWEQFHGDERSGKHGRG